MTVLDMNLYDMNWSDQIKGLAFTDNDFLTVAVCTFMLRVEWFGELSVLCMLYIQPHIKPHTEFLWTKLWNILSGLLWFELIFNMLLGSLCVPFLRLLFLLFYFTCLYTRFELSGMCTGFPGGVLWYKQLNSYKS